MNGPLTREERDKLIKLVEEGKCENMPADDAWYAAEEIAATFKLMDEVIDKAKEILKGGYNSTPEIRGALWTLEQSLE